MTVQQKIETTAKLAAQDIRDYVRDHFELRERLDLTPLDNLHDFVQRKVHAAILSMKGVYACIQCQKVIDVEKVRCGECSLTPLGV